MNYRAFALATVLGLATAAMAVAQTPQTNNPSGTTASPNAEAPSQTKQPPKTGKQASQRHQQNEQTASAQAGLIDLNTAAPAQLHTLPGIGKARANSIIKNRPYKSADDLVTKKVIPGKVYEGIKDKVTVR